MKKLDRSFYEGNTLEVAKKLLGKILVHRYENKEVMGRIVEVEAYIGAIDKACHCYNNRRTERTKIMFGPPGYAYVYFIYGMYNCMNVVTGKEGEGAAVLIRALEPLKGLDEMVKNRYGKNINEIDKRKLKNLTNGPGKLCQALNITRKNYGDDLTKDRLFILDDGYKSFDIKSSKRINIDYAEEAKDFEWRFFIDKNPYISK
ncbi:DNA-3-methyladenine glycosylase [Caminicella sporogenes DSM 14501]|uniref:Putative 3-methyladenine DNA glycosylase n=1 Tax=Caminicella sporogenes DSM 14501 TaxID=1121266 RepID=A0A1M6SHB5_9FIRM|nr:DNA-3-methyladenine glycosylase [Caminicella sporogenes]RKD26658.1 3-methyladenine DNA glycosylase [Caminicella sporogenes]WIF95965.1 DNA-3-methyladenine glycosylase [Caminicella sporogenes]SHK44144.1 DNA-3-methyladenine glycosylase [Caminicella sporogenes DSM 14501]